MRGVLFNADAELKVWLDEFFNSQPRDFYQRGIESLAERWEKIINSDDTLFKINLLKSTTFIQTLVVSLYIKTTFEML